MINLELLSEANIDAVRAIHREDIPVSWVDDTDTLWELTQYGLKHNCKGHTYAVKYGDDYIGVILLGEAIPWETDPAEMKNEPFYRLMGFVIDKRYRSKGIGGKVLEMVIDAIYQEYGVRPIALGVHNDNHGAAKFYERHGFTPVDAMEGNDRYYIRHPKRESIKNMEIKRINTYEDDRFSEKVLLQHGCFLVDGKPYEVEIISDYEAVISGTDEAVYAAIIEEFRFYTPHITRFYNRDKQTVKEYPPARLLTLCLDQIQPSQFFVDEDKIAAISSFIHKPQDIIIQVLPNEDRFISLDGHTRLYYAVMKEWECVRAVVESSDDWVYKFVTEAQQRGIHTPKEMTLVSHAEYEEKWNRFCDQFFAEALEKQ